MKKKSTYEIDGNLYEFDNEKFKKIIKSKKNNSRGACEQFYREVVSRGIGISYDTVKGWVKNDTNPALDDVKTLAEILEVPYMQLLECTHYSADVVHTRLQRITFDEIINPFSLKYEGFSNVFDAIIGMGYNPTTGECKDSDFAERIISIIGCDKICEYSLPELLGYKFAYSDEELHKMTDEELMDAVKSGYIDDDGNCLYDNEFRVSIDRHMFGRRLIENALWLDIEERKELQAVIEEAKKWWDYCDMPFALLKINIVTCELQLASFTYGDGWVKPTHEDRWRLILDVLELLGPHIYKSGLCWIHEMHVDQFESEFFVTIKIF